MIVSDGRGRYPTNGRALNETKAGDSIEMDDPTIMEYQFGEETDG